MELFGNLYVFAPVGNALFTYGWIPLQLSTYDNYALEQFDKTIRLFKLMENVHLLGYTQNGW